MIQITSAMIRRMPTIVQMRPLFMFEQPVGDSVQPHARINDAGRTLPHPAVRASP